MSRVADRLARVVGEAASAVGVAVTLGPLASRPWYSALFSGERHTATLVGPDDAGTAAWLAALPELALPIPGHIAEVAVDRVTRNGGTVTAALAFLTVEN